MYVDRDKNTEHAKFESKPSFKMNFPSHRQGTGQNSGISYGPSSGINYGSSSGISYGPSSGISSGPSSSTSDETKTVRPKNPFLGTLKCS